MSNGGTPAVKTWLQARNDFQLVPEWTLVLITFLLCGVGLFCYTLFMTDAGHTGFSLIPQRASLFEEDETDLFKTPIRGNTFKTAPYYDHSDVDEESSQSDEDIVDVLEIQQNIRKQQQYVM